MYVGVVSIGFAGMRPPMVFVEIQSVSGITCGPG